MGLLSLYQRTSRIKRNLEGVVRLVVFGVQTRRSWPFTAALLESYAHWTNGKLTAKSAVLYESLGVRLDPQRNGKERWTPTCQGSSL